MTELEVLKKIATEALKARNLKRQYDILMREYVNKYPLADQRFSQKAVSARKQVTDPIYGQIKEAKRRLEGYLFIYECKEWVK